jgi:hypothetical protein
VRGRGTTSGHAHDPLRVMRYVFTAYLLLIAVGLTVYIAIGFTNPQ